MDLVPPPAPGNPNYESTTNPTAPIPVRPTNNGNPNYESTTNPTAPIPVRPDDGEYCDNACLDEMECQEMCSEIELEWGWSADEQSDTYLPYAGCFVTGNKCYFGNFEGGEYEFDEIFEVGRKSRLCCDDLFEPDADGDEAF